MKTIQMTAAISAVFLILLFSGCGPEKVDLVQVSGAITLDGEPLDSGSIKFVAVNGDTPTGGGTIKDGTYTAMVPPGEKKVLVLAYEIVGQEPLYKDVPDSPMRDKMELVTPEAYNAEHLTPLEATITEAQEGLNFELKSKL